MVTALLTLDLRPPRLMGLACSAVTAVLSLGDSTKSAGLEEPIRKWSLIRQAPEKRMKSAI